MMIVMVVWGGYNIATGHIHYRAIVDYGTPVSGMSFVLLIRAFSAGSSSLTGVEAVSNAVPNFNKPKEKNASTTLAIMSAILAFFFIAVIFFSFYLGVVPNSRTTILSQMAAQIFGGHGLGFYLLQLSTAMILALLLILVSQPFQFLPLIWPKINICRHAFMDRGDRLGYSNGIISWRLEQLF